MSDIKQALINIFEVAKNCVDCKTYPHQYIALGVQPQDCNQLVAWLDDIRLTSGTDGNSRCQLQREAIINLSLTRTCIVSLNPDGTVKFNAQQLTNMSICVIDDIEKLRCCLIENMSLILASTGIRSHGVHIIDTIFDRQISGDAYTSTLRVLVKL